MDRGQKRSKRKLKRLKQKAKDVDDASRSLVREKMGLDQTPEQAKRLARNTIVPLSRRKASDIMKRQLEAPFVDMLPSILVIVGPVKSGKTALMLNLLTRKELFGDLADELWIASPTVGLDDSWEILGDMQGVHFDRVADSNLLKDIEAAQTDYQDSHRGARLHQGLVIDDAVGMAATVPGFKTSLGRFSTLFRHVVDFLIISTQSMKVVLDPVLRGNVGGWIVMYDTTPNERMKLWEEIYPVFRMPNASFLDGFFEKHIKTKHSFMFIAMGSKEIYYCFTKLIYSVHKPQDVTAALQA